MLGIDFAGGTLPAGEGVLAELSFDETLSGSTLDLSDIVVSTSADGGLTLSSNTTASADVPGCDNADCAGECGGSAVEDECGECNGSGPEENFDCDGNCVVDTDCAGECGGSTVVDDCGECGGCLLYTSDAADE